MRVMAILATLLCALRSHDTYARLRHHSVLRGQRGFFNPCFSENRVSVWDCPRSLQPAGAHVPQTTAPS